MTPVERGAGLTSTQRRVLAWLTAYPGVTLSARMDGSRVGWSHWWAGEAARADMVAVTSRLGMDMRGSAPRAAAIDGPTPAITRPTFAALQRRGLLQLTRQWRGTAHFTISRRGILTLSRARQQP